MSNTSISLYIEKKKSEQKKKITFSQKTPWEKNTRAKSDFFSIL